MLNDIEERIEYFFNAIKSIKEHTDKIDLEFAHAPIYFILLDILAKYAFPNENKGNMRFLNLIDSYSNWEYKNYFIVKYAYSNRLDKKMIGLPFLKWREIE